MEAIEEVSERSNEHSDEPKNSNLLGRQNHNDSFQIVTHKRNTTAYLDSSVDPMNIGMSPNNSERIPRRIQLRPQAKI